MRYRDRTAAGNLFAEYRHDAARRVEHVAESHRDEPAIRCGGAGLHVLFGQPFTCSHHAGGIHGLVGGNHHERASAVFVGQIDEIARGQDDVFHRFAAMRLHERDVLVSRRVKDDFRPRLGE